MLCCEKAGAEDGRVKPSEDPELTRNIWNHHAAALLARSTIVKVEDAD
jgi:hypothetical protein